MWKRLSRLAEVALVCFAAMLSFASAATEFTPSGSSGGNAFRDDCPAGQFVVGARYRSGAWLDQFAILCAPVDAAGMTGAPTPGTPFGGGGGGPGEKVCNPGYIVTGALILLHPGNQFVHMMDLNCRSTVSTARYSLTNVGSPSSLFGDVGQFCPEGEAVTGIKGRAGLYLDAIGMICGPIAQAAPARPEPRPEACLRLKEDPVPAQWKDMLDAHNARRAQHCVAPLIWSNELAAAAQEYAGKCILDTHGSDGENMADAWAVENGSPKLPALSDKEAFERTWYCEVKNYDFDNPAFKGGFTFECKDVNGHFTQVVWKDTCQLGCGRADCDITDAQGVKHKGTHWVCRYKPPGNMNTSDVEVLKSQVKPPLCAPKQDG